MKRILIIMFVFSLILNTSIGCSAIKVYSAAKYGIGVSSERWIGVYQMPVEEHVGIIVADINKFADFVESKFVYKNEALKIEGAGSFRGEIKENKLLMIGRVTDSVYGNAAIVMEGEMRDEIMEGIFAQQIGNTIFRGKFILIRLTHTSYLGGIPRGEITKTGEALIDLGASTSGLLGPGHQNAYGPGIHSDSTGRPFSWRTDDGQFVSGPVKENAYGLGVGMDQFGRPVRAKPLW